MLVYWLLLDVAQCLHMEKCYVPKHAEENAIARLECCYDLENDTLYSLKWYKDRREFYRRVPSELPEVRLFPVAGVHVNVGVVSEKNQTTGDVIVLERLDSQSSGTYACEVSAEAPSFETISSEGELIVDKRDGN